MTAYRIEQIHSDWFAVMYDDRRVAILTPARPAAAWPPFPAEPWSIIPDPEAFPDAACTGLPRPLSPVGNRFGSFCEVLAFLGIPADAREAEAA